MTRIVAGSAGGRTLQVPGKGTRPTSDRVREALFSRLDHADLLDGARVLDLYAGSGALGLEAASRGAVAVVLVESARAAADVCRRNAAAVGIPGVQVVAERVLPFLRRPVRERYDVVLVDPPYELDEAELAGVLAALTAHLAPEAVVVVERSTRSPEPAWPAGGPAAGLVRTAEKRYGETVLWFAEATGVALDDTADDAADGAADVEGEPAGGPRPKVAT
ncbi:16S rRNA (guanine(966)-N(2))-methyltransferase RsmD [Actinotalea subterranea]|uniref:16S rRNA (guanine(966)-N(2))-methyltransferase RsmD n=1 Tax=Actinotalea subterranea TaxID=2607497 RepID=UPI0011EE0DC5|nr:16S rRNA (guanine(966)-N(2))-methyltransferase RsmD [Actinotalea subterranea]